VPSLDEWQALGIISGAIIALLTLLRLAMRGVRRMFRLISKASQFLDQVIGDEKRPSLMELLAEQMRRLDHIEQVQAEHMELWHRQKPTPNGGRPRPMAADRGRPQ
jgi:hypothetical protein